MPSILYSLSYRCVAGQMGAVRLLIQPNISVVVVLHCDNTLQEDPVERTHNSECRYKEVTQYHIKTL